jgi:hypothetical protein
VRWCQQTGQTLAGAGADPATVAAVNGLGALVGVPVPVLRATGGLAADPERYLVAKYLRMLPAARQDELAELLTVPSRPESGDPATSEGPATEDLSDAELSAAATGDDHAVDRLCRHAAAVALAGDTDQLRALLGRWNRSVDETVGAASATWLQDALLVRELGRHPAGCR